MNIPRKKIIIGCSAALAVLIVIVIVLISYKSNSQSIFKGCDGFPDPTDDIVISSCPHGDNAGYCELVAARDTNITLSFTPSKWRFSCDQGLL